MAEADLTGITIFLTLVLGILVIVVPRILRKIRGDQADLEKAANDSDNDFESKYSDASRFMVVMGGASIALGISYLLSDQPPSFTGRWAWLIYPIYKVAGNFSVFLWFFILGVIVIVFAIYPEKKNRRMK